MTHICVSELPIIGSDNGLSPGQRQAIIWTNAGILLFRTLGTNFSEILSEIHTFSFKKMHLKMSSAKWRTFCLGINVLTNNDVLGIQHFNNVLRSCNWICTIISYFLRNWSGIDTKNVPRCVISRWYSQRQIMFNCRCVLVSRTSD